MYKILFLTITLIGLISCGDNKSVDSPELRVEVENRKIKQIHEPDILARALKIGNEIAQKSQTNLGKALKAQIKENGISD